MHTIRIGIVGGGIVGLATALNLARRFPAASISIFEKESEIGLHQTSHNSGVIHSGVYYQPGSLKAQLCTEGAKKLIAFCQENSIPIRITGKIIVATAPAELKQLDILHQRAGQNGLVGIKKLEKNEFQEIEPYADGVGALWVPGTAIVDYKQVAQAYANIFLSLGGNAHTNTKIIGIQRNGDQWLLETKEKEFSCDFLINCAGLFSDQIAMLCGLKPDVRTIPFRGEYYKLLPAYEYLVKGLIYPVPNPLLPFLGAHCTVMVSGGVEVGPNAVLALAREGYKPYPLRPVDMARMGLFPGFWKLLRRYGKLGAFEIHHTQAKNRFVETLQRLVPAVTADMLVPAASGVRAQAVNAQGKFVDDFYFVEQAQALHVLNAPSPAASSSLAMGEYITNKIAARIAAL